MLGSAQNTLTMSLSMSKHQPTLKPAPAGLTAFRSNVELHMANEDMFDRFSTTVRDHNANVAHLSTHIHPQAHSRWYPNDPGPGPGGGGGGLQHTGAWGNTRPPLAQRPPPAKLLPPAIWDEPHLSTTKFTYT